MRRTRALLPVSLVVALVLAAGTIAARQSPAGSNLLLGQVLRLVSTQYVDPLSDSALFERAARGLVRELGDPYSQLLTPRDLQSFQQTTLGRYGGVGMLLLPVGDSTIIEKVYPGTPAERAGIRPGDRLLRVGDTTTLGLPLEKVSGLLRGEPGSAVGVVVQRTGTARPIVADMRRAVVRLPAIPYTLTLDDGIAYIPLTSFNETSGRETRARVLEAMEHGARGIVLDLRGNGGGSFDDALTVSNLFLPQGSDIVSVRYRKRPTELSRATELPVAPSIPLVVLQDDGTASASEIVTGALQDNDRAVVVGTTSFGKGLVQSVFPLDGGYALKLTTGTWHTPVGRSIHRTRSAADSARRRGDVAEADSLETDSVKKERPEYRSRGGRVLHGGGAITPDIIVPADTLTAEEFALARTLASQAGAVSGVLSRYALDLVPGAKADFVVRPEWQEEFYRRMVAAGVKVERARYDAARGYVTRLLEQRLSTLAYGDSTARRRELARDSQLASALKLLRGTTSQNGLMARADSTRSRGE